MGKFYYVPAKRLVHRGTKGKRSGGSWDDTLKTFEGTRMFTKAKFYVSLLKSQNLSPGEGDVLRLKDAACNASILLRNLINGKTTLSSDSRKFLKRLREQGAPEANSLLPRATPRRSKLTCFLSFFSDSARAA